MKFGASKMISLSYDLYGVKGAALLSVKEILEDSIGLSFYERESSYQGGVYYYSGDRVSESLIIKNNLDPFDEEPVELNFSDWPVLIYVNSTGRAFELEKIMTQDERIVLLRREKICTSDS